MVCKDEIARARAVAGTLAAVGAQAAVAKEAAEAPWLAAGAPSFAQKERIRPGPSVSPYRAKSGLASVSTYHLMAVLSTSARVYTMRGELGNYALI